MGNMRENNKQHILFEPIKDIRHLVELAREKKREFLHIPLFIILFAIAILSFQKTISVIQAAGKTREKITYIEKNCPQYASEYNLAGCGLKEGEKIEFTSNPAEVLRCEEFFDEICSICGKTEGELELEKKFEKEHQIQAERERAKARQAAALARRRAAAPLPVSAKKVNGKLVCAKKNDKPRKSKENHNGMHWDRECCLDPDEWPNPWCTY